MIARTATLVVLVLLALGVLGATHAPAAHHAAAAKHAAPAANAGDPARLMVLHDTVATSADLQWEQVLIVVNPSDQGLYLDSLFCDVEDRDPNQGGTPVPTHIELSPLIRIFSTVSAHDTILIEHTGPAAAESALVAYRLCAHRSDGRRLTLTATALARPGASASYQSSYIDVDGSRIEYVVVPALGTSEATPGLLLIGDRNAPARHMIRAGRLLAGRGFTVALVGFVGSGGSTTPADAQGPPSVWSARTASTMTRGAARVLEALAHDSRVDNTRLVVWGIGQGATVAATLAEQPVEDRGGVTIGALVLQSGLYDLGSGYRAAPEPVRADIARQADTDSAAWRARSPLTGADRITTPVLLLHGERDPRHPADQAHAMADALARRGKPTESRFFPNAQSQLPAGEVQRSVIAFLQKSTGGK